MFAEGLLFVRQTLSRPSWEQEAPQEKRNLASSILDLEREYSVKGDSILLISPPGWGLNVGGPHMALPLLKGFLESQSIPTTILDLNLASAKHYGVTMVESDVVSACQNPTLPNLNHPYYIAQQMLDSIASSSDGKWDIQDGFRHAKHDPACSNSTRLYSEKTSPFTKYFCSEAIPHIMASEPRVIGLSVVMNSQLAPAFQLCRLLRKAGYIGEIILGGNAVTRIGEKLVLDWVFEIVDGLVFFQGEYALSELWKTLQKGEYLDRVPNMVWKKDGKVIWNRSRPLAQSDFVGPDFDGFQLEDYWGVSYLPIIGARGCYYGNCSFCDTPYGWGNGGFLGYSSADNVFRDMKRLFCVHGINRFKFVEESLHPSVVKSLVDLINRESFDCHFEGYARFDSFWNDPNFLAKASKAGLRKVYLGLEISPSSSRSRLNKSDAVAGVETLSRFYDAGIKTHLFCMFGCPGTGTKEAYATIDFALRHSKLIDTLDISPFYYAKHAKVDLVVPVPDPNKDWALAYEYSPRTSKVLLPNQVAGLCRELEELIWREHPVWLHPVYRMYSPWQESVQSLSDLSRFHSTSDEVFGKSGAHISELALLDEHLL